ncbi:hypothetical protein KY290_016706 [Solanum tuberosum]|uniref:Uncharacterized protein n=1 Tax=Solanum tuberosum TaxID=4113 RepID=A0ABQ7VA51_SOLTU|nr:hypothetical protein KY284_015989 [Solanum tuberosum]KAH0760633.1 hypothetical protein KY290_016706 [Solanum tuberosum]
MDNILNTLSLVAFARSFTFENPIVLPTSCHDDDDNLILPEVYDQDGDPLRIGESYIIKNPLLGAGAVYLYNIGNLQCPNAVLQHMSIPVGEKLSSSIDTQQRKGRDEKDKLDSEISEGSKLYKLV